MGTGGSGAVWYNARMPTIQEIGLHCAPLFKQYGVTRASVFGSIARGNARPDSDVDMIVSLEKPLGLFKFYAMNDQLEELLGRKVDLMTPKSINPHLARRVAGDLKVIYEG